MPFFGSCLGVTCSSLRCPISDGVFQVLRMFIGLAAGAKLGSSFTIFNQASLLALIVIPRVGGEREREKNRYSLKKTREERSCFHGCRSSMNVVLRSKKLIGFKGWMWNY